MKIKKVKITKQNINAIYGRLNKFFKSIKLGEEYYCKKWDKKSDYSYTFCKADIELKDNQIIFESPIRFKISIGDSIHLDGNTFIIQRKLRQYDNSIFADYHLFKRKRQEWDYLKK